MTPTTEQDLPRMTLRRNVTAYLAKMRGMGLSANRSLTFCGDAECDDVPQTRGWMLVDPRTAYEHWLLLDDGDVWHEIEPPSRVGPHLPAAPTYEWLDRPHRILQQLMSHSLFSARLGGTGFLADEERFARRPYVVGDRRLSVTTHPGPERRHIAA
jgi:hypothetical protein